ncbi:hypothetical protein Tco_0899626 [Tanacetum coccineum]
MAVNNLYQPWRAILSMINQCLTGKTFGHDRPRYLVLQMLWGIITIPPRRAEKKSLMLFLIVDSRSLSSVIWEELTIFTKDQHLHCILLKNTSDWVISNSFPKGEKYEVFGMPIPNELILNNIRNALYYSAYLEIVTKHDQKITAEQSGKKKPATAKQPKLKPASKPAPAPEPKFIFQRRTPATEEASTGPSAQPQDDTSANIVRDSPSPSNAITGDDTDKINSGGDTEIIPFGDERGDDVANVVNLEERTAKFDEDQAGSDPVDEHVILEDPLSSTGALSLRKNLDDAFTIGDQFVNDKATEDDQEKLNVESEVVSMVTVLIYQL